MTKLVQVEKVHLFSVSESLNEQGLYALELFDPKGSSSEFDRDHIDDELKDLVDRLFGSGECFEIDANTDYDDGGNIRIEVGGESCLVIPDIIEKIDTDPEKSTFYVLVDAEYTEYRWVVIEPSRTVFRG